MMRSTLIRSVVQTVTLCRDSLRKLSTSVLYTSVRLHEPPPLPLMTHYVGTPHTDHYNSARSALLAKKHVLLEKPVTCNAAELRSLAKIAKREGVFFMEAMWTRFLPTIKEFKKVVEDGKLGNPVVMWADFLVDFNINSGYSVECLEWLTHITRYSPSNDTQDVGSDAWRWRIAGSVSVHPRLMISEICNFYNFSGPYPLVWVCIL
jgi:hypothetical protein